MRNKVVALAVLGCLCQPFTAFADDVPTFDVGKSCRVDVQASAGQSTAGACMADEQRARQTLLAQWTTFTAESRTACGKMVNDIPGLQSYVELLTCLQTTKISSGLPKN